MSTKTPVEEFPYKTYLNILHGPLELIDVQKLADACTDKWYNQTLCKVNDSVVRMAVVQGEYHWHEHKDIDEFFFVLDGRFLIRMAVVQGEYHWHKHKDIDEFFCARWAVPDRSRRSRNQSCVAAGLRRAERCAPSPARARTHCDFNGRAHRHCSYGRLELMVAPSAVRDRRYSEGT